MSDLSIFEFNGDSIREIDGQFSVYDIIRVIGGQKSEHKVWERLSKIDPELIKHCRLEVTNKNQSDPFCDKITALKLVKILSGKLNKFKEEDIRKAVASFYKECGETTSEEVKCEFGIADIVTTYQVVEVKAIDNWKQALGQAIVFSLYFGLSPAIVLFGGNGEKNSIIFKVANELKIGCSILHSEDIRAFLENKGCFSETNEKYLTLKFKQELKVKLSAENLPMS